MAIGGRRNLSQQPPEKDRNPFWTFAPDRFSHLFPSELLLYKCSSSVFCLLEQCALTPIKTLIDQLFPRSSPRPPAQWAVGNGWRFSTVASERDLNKDLSSTEHWTPPCLSFRL